AARLRDGCLTSTISSGRRTLTSPGGDDCFTGVIVDLKSECTGAKGKFARPNRSVDGRCAISVQDVLDCRRTIDVGLVESGVGKHEHAAEVDVGLPGQVCARGAVHAQKGVVQKRAS